jgi:post-segregation antitoxin (ccd killing protein)
MGGGGSSLTPRTSLGTPYAVTRPSQIGWCVYSMRMARVNVYLPDDLADAARAADLNISSLTQDAVRRELHRTGIEEWVQTVSRFAKPGVSHDAVQKAIDAAREELGTAGG